MESRELAKQICEALADKKGEDIKILNISEVTVLADYFIIASGSNRNQVQAMADNVEEHLESLVMSQNRSRAIRAATGS